MDKLTRRSLLRTLAGGALGTFGTVVIARASLAGAAEDAITPGGDLADRATRLAELGPEGMTSAPAQLFLNGGVPGLFGNAPFRNFRNGGFLNGPFGNGGFGNGGFRNGGFRNGGFRNGGPFRNGGGFRNFRNW